MTIHSPGGKGSAQPHEVPGQPARTPPVKPKLLSLVRQAIRSRHDSPRTEQAYVHWIRRYIFFHKVRHPADVLPQLNAFLSHLAMREHVSASTQNQAFSALVSLSPCSGTGPRGTRDTPEGQATRAPPARSAREARSTRSCAPRRRAAAHGGAHVRLGLASAQVRPPSRQGRRLRPSRGHRPRWQGSKDRVTVLPSGLASPCGSTSIGSAASTAPIWGRPSTSRCPMRGPQVSERPRRVGLAVGLSCQPHVREEHGRPPPASPARDRPPGDVRRRRAPRRDLKPATPHTLRHSFATDLLERATTSAPSRSSWATATSAPR